MDDPEDIIRQAKRASRMRKAKEKGKETEKEKADDIERDAVQEQGDNYNFADPEVPDFLDGDPWDLYYETVKHEALPRIHFTDSETPISTRTNPSVRFYKNLGYLPPLDESTLELLKELLPEEYGLDMAKITGRINPADMNNFQSGLDGRNVIFDRFPDAYLDHIKSLDPKAPEETSQERGLQIRAWERDLKKVNDDSSEAIFQRTIMMSMIDRHRLINHQEDDIIDFAVEKPWTCPPMPSKLLMSAYQKSLTQPKADLALAFHHRAIFRQRYWGDIPTALKEVVCYEGDKTNRSRIFHFMTIEGKNACKNIHDPIAALQNLNSASQSLHNMYEFFREAGGNHVDIFFEKVRFFSAVSTSSGIQIRIHRACLTTDDIEEPPHEQPVQVPDRLSIGSDYPLQFVFDDFFEASGSSFTRENVVDVFEKIIIGYAMGELRFHLKNAAKAIEDKVFEYRKNHGKLLERSTAYYSHGMVDPYKEQRSLRTRFNRFMHPSEPVHRRPGQSELRSQGREDTQMEDAPDSGSAPVEPMGSQVVPRKRQRTD